MMSSSADPLTCSVVNINERQRIAETCSALKDQILVVQDESERAIGEAIQLFTEFAEETERSANQARCSLSTTQTEGATGAFQEAQSALDGILVGQNRLGTQIQQASNSITEVVSTARRISSRLGKIDSIARQTTMLAINASIEASRADSARGGMTAIAKEIQRLSTDAHSLAQVLRNEIEHLAVEGGYEAQSLQDAEEQAAVELRHSESSLRHLVGTLSDASAQTQSALTALASQSESISKRQQQVVTVFQFQDLMRQRLEHVVDPLSELSRCLSSPDTPIPDAQSLINHQQWTSGNSAEFAVAALPSTETVSYSVQSEGDVTLF